MDRGTGGAAAALGVAEWVSGVECRACSKPHPSRSAVVDICLGPDGNSQDCGIACKVTKDKEACAEWEKKTVAICEKISKEECQEICAKDKNPKACELAKAK